MAGGYFKQYSLLGIKSIFNYFKSLKVTIHDFFSLCGFFIFLTIINQIVSGIMLALGLNTESMFIPLVREEEDLENLYTDDFFWLHERGVDSLFIFMFIHLLRKLYMQVNGFEQEGAWKQGAIAFLLVQVIVFTGLVLCSTHLSEITLVIATNAIQTFFFFVGKVYWAIAPDKSLNVDTLTRLGYLHYILPFILLGISINHGVDMHYDWKNEPETPGSQVEVIWWDEALCGEIGRMMESLLLLGLLCLYLYAEPEALSYEIFMWGDVGMTTDIRYLGVAPHWYFRPYMSWLIVCPYHHVGIFGLIYFFIIFYYQPQITEMCNGEGFKRANAINIGFLPMRDAKTYMLLWTQPLPWQDALRHWSFSIFCLSVLYTYSYLPFGKFFSRLGGNGGTLFAYLYIFIYLGVPQFRAMWLTSTTRVLIIN